MPKDRSAFYPAFLYNWKFQEENTMKKTNDFTEGSILPKLLGFAFPVLLALFCGIATSVLARLCLSYLFYTYVLYFYTQNHIGVPTSIKLPSKS